MAFTITILRLGLILLSNYRFMNFFCFKLLFGTFVSLWFDDVKNKFLKIKNIIYIYFQVKNALRTNLFSQFFNLRRTFWVLTKISFRLIFFYLKNIIDEIFNLFFGPGFRFIEANIFAKTKSSIYYWIKSLKIRYEINHWTAWVNG